MSHGDSSKWRLSQEEPQWRYRTVPGIFLIGLLFRHAGSRSFTNLPVLMTVVAVALVVKAICDILPALLRSKKRDHK